jgi:hypothetical protein
VSGGGLSNALLATNALDHILDLVIRWPAKSCATFDVVDQFVCTVDRYHGFVSLRCPLNGYDGPNPSLAKDLASVRILLKGAGQELISHPTTFSLVCLDRL